MSDHEGKKEEALYFENNSDAKPKYPWQLIGLVAIFVLALIIAGAAFFQVKYQNKIFPGVRIGKINLSGLTHDEALDVISKITADIEKNGLKFVYHNDNQESSKVAPVISAVDDPDLSRSVIDFQNEATVNTALSAGRSNNWFINFLEKTNALVFDKKINARFELNDIALKAILTEQFSELEKPTIDARPEITITGDDYNVTIIPEETGRAFDYIQAISQAKYNLSQLESGSININTKITPATITSAEAENNLDKVKALAAKKNITFKYDTDTWPLSQKTFLTLIEWQKINGEIVAGLNYDRWHDWLEKYVAPDINIPAQDAKIDLIDGRVNKIIPHQSGIAIDYEKTYWQMRNDLSDDKTEISIVTEKSQPKILISDVNDLGIEEIIGIGTSNFSGSPTNRRHNIKVGAARIHGLLVAPGAEFSLTSALGEIDATSGYLPELVIKDNKTVPEYGGGLCQIGTTLFRAAMGSGLPITERRAHAYSVPYYLENGLPGVDATIYIPSPDVKFVNDTANYILIQTYVKGDNVRFEFWGTKDGRTAKRTTPKTWGWIAPPETKYIETTDLPAGKKKCTESAHYGVSASFDYIVTYTNGETKTTTFSSKYKPWQAVCLIGVEKLSSDVTSSTEPLLESNASSTLSQN